MTKILSTTVAEPCGCKGGYDHEGFSGIEFCPKHAAAQTMYEALETIWPALRRCGYSDNSVEIRAIENAMRTARGESQ